MDLNSIRNALGEQPFRPFELCLADGRRIPVKPPEFVAMNQRIVIVTTLNTGLSRFRERLTRRDLGTIEQISEGRIGFNQVAYQRIVLVGRVERMNGN